MAMLRARGDQGLGGGWPRARGGQGLGVAKG